jgi:hypothetical protein
MLRASRYANFSFLFSPFFVLEHQQEKNAPAGPIANVVLKSSHCHVGMPTILSVPSVASRKSLVGNQRIQVFAKSLPVVSTHYCPPNLPAHPSSLSSVHIHQSAINTYL